LQSGFLIAGALRYCSAILPRLVRLAISHGLFPYEKILKRGDGFRGHRVEWLLLGFMGGCLFLALLFVCVCFIEKGENHVF